MRTTAWAMLGSLVITLVLGGVIAAVSSLYPAAAAQSSACPAHAAAPNRQAPAQPARSGHRYIVAVRMGWAL
jgi:hypothetical protein